MAQAQPYQLRSRLKEYGLVTPFSTDSHGHFLSHLLSASHKQRTEQKLFFNITAFGKEFHLRLRPNSRLVAPGAMVEWHDTAPAAGNLSANGTDPGGAPERILRRELLKTDCTFIGDISDVPGASVAINNCDGLGKVIQNRNLAPAPVWLQHQSGSSTSSLLGPSGSLTDRPAVKMTVNERASQNTEFKSL
ncbi:unnamed protein product [Pleuronectes platessa]|uniref:Peptidase M12B propeptide domain-containing protein n=1 Tax=Pleuronectes platessa TaxID=8262 RepID=A0A9N7UIC7_PLEPL|nr:unnamed protein product [Pleuronectes platessa]